MSLFSPISNRSAATKALYLVVYLLLTAGALTMMLPLLISISGAMSGPREAVAISLYPRFLFSENALWSRFLEARYGGAIDNYKMAWGEESLDFYGTPPAPKQDAAALALWKTFLGERGMPGVSRAGLAFTRVSNQDASLENVRFQNWLSDRYEGDFSKLNNDLATEFVRKSAAVPPPQNRIVLLDIDNPYSSIFKDYLETVPPTHRLIWDVGGFYRAVFLPRLHGSSIQAYNAEAGTKYQSFSEIPFPAELPTGENKAWFRFVGQILNPAFVQFTPEGEAAWQASGKGKLDFIRMEAKPQHLRVASLDVEYAQWASERGVADARIPQAALDWEAFRSGKGFWRWQFATQNFSQVIQEVLVQGNGVRNTVILVVLSVIGTLTVNPVAAYALSRFKLQQSYQILLFLLATIAFPAEVAMIPNFLQIKELGMINTFWALVIPGLVSGFSIFLLKGFFDSLPRELYEAADIDGAGEWQIFWGITMNLSKPILAVMALGAFTSAYGAFMFALILAPDPSMWTLMVWIYQLQQTSGQGIIYASILITAFPMLVVYLCTQNMIMRGIIVPSEK